MSTVANKSLSVLLSITLALVGFSLFSVGRAQADEGAQTQSATPGTWTAFGTDCEWNIDGQNVLHLRSVSGKTGSFAEMPAVPDKTAIAAIAIDSQIKAQNTPASGSLDGGVYVSRLFAGFSSITTIDGLNQLDTSAMKDMGDMFYDCSSLVTLDFSTFNTANVRNMGGMFWGCSSLTSLNISSFNTANVTNFENMFHDCSKLQALNLSNFNTSKATSMFNMFMDCSSLTELDLSSFHTSLVGSFARMFYGCSSLTSVNVTSFDSSKVTEFAGMFEGCSSLKSVDVSSFNTAESLTAADMFDNAIETIKVGDTFTVQADFPNKTWYNTAGQAFASPSDIPVNVADAYTCVVPITGIAIATPAKTELTTGETLQLTATKTPANSTEPLIWYSDNTNVATVSSTGLITAVADGTARIYAAKGPSFNPNNINDSVEIKVGSAQSYSIVISPSAKTVKEDDGPFTLTATIMPAGSYAGPKTWTSSDPSVATIDNNGTVTPLKAGEATMTFEITDASAQCVVQVLPATAQVVDVESVTLDKSSVTLTGAQSETLQATVFPADASNKTVKWTSSNPSVVNVDQSGKLTPVSMGTASITAASADDLKKTTCAVTVLNPPTSLILATSTTSIEAGETLSIGANGKGALTGATEALTDYAWTSSDDTVVKVQGSGSTATMTGMAAGTATVTVTAKYDGKTLSASDSITVTQSASGKILLSDASKNVVVGDAPFMLTATVETAAPQQDGAQQDPITWSSSDSSVASVDDDGNVTPLKTGTANIKAQCGGLSANCLVTVLSKSISTASDSEINGSLVIDDAAVAAELADAKLRIRKNTLDGLADVTRLALGAADEGSILVTVYEIDLVDSANNDKQWANADGHTVKVNIEADEPILEMADANRMNIHYIDLDDDEAETMKTWMTETSVVYETTHFSTYALTATPFDEDANSLADPADRDMKAVGSGLVGGGLATTGDNRAPVLLVLAVLFAMSGLAVMGFRKTRML